MAWLPIPVLLTAILALKTVNLQTSHECSFLLVLLNFVISTSVSMVVVVLVARSSLAHGTPGLVLFGCGVLIWGAAGAVGPALLAQDGNLTISIHNILAWISALCHLTGVTLSLKPTRTIRRVELTLALAYTAATGIVWLVTILVLEGWTPVFFVQGYGGTPLRQLVLGSAMMMFALTAILLWSSNRRTPTSFVRWYALSMMLVATGLFGIMLQTSHGSFLSWTGRGTQLLGSAYMLMAALSSLRDSGTKIMDLSTGLAESEEKLLLFAEHAPAAIAMFDTKMRYITASNRWLEDFGMKGQDLRGRSHYQIFHEIPERWKEIHRRCLAGATERAEEDAFVRADGSTQWLRWEVRPWHTASGAVGGLIILSEDISARKKGQEQLQLLSAALGTAASSIAITDLEGTIQWINPAFTKLTGYGMDEAAGMNMRVLNSGKHQPGFYREMWETILHGQPWHGEIVDRRKDGTLYTEEMTIDPVRAACGDAITHFVAIKEDITERKRTETAIYLSEQFARTQWAEAEAALEAVPANIAILDTDGVIVRVNKAWTTFAYKGGVAPESVAVGVNYLEMCDAVRGEEAEQAAAFAAGIRSVISRERECFSMEYPCHSPEERRWFMGYVTSHPGEGPARAVVAHVDITAQKLIEEEIRNLNQELESRVVERTSELQITVDALEAEMVERRRLERDVLKISEREQSRIGRDLHDGACQNLACIVVLSEVAARELDREKSQTAARVREISEIARQSMDEVRRLAAGLFPVKIEQYGLEWALKELAAETSARGHVQCNFTMRQPVTFTDTNAMVQLYRIAQEAVSNALRHGQARNITLELAMTNGTVTLGICDDGTGMSPQQNNGGLGLHTMRYRARTLGGTLKVDTTVKQGTTVICSFPGKEFTHSGENGVS